MRKEITVTAEPRETRGKNEARRLRVKGLAPAVLYGANGPSVAVAVSPKEVNKILHSQNDPVRENLLHVDLKRIDLTKRIHVKVRVQTTGEAKGVKLQGGLMEAITREIEIECLPDEIPESFTVDVTELMIGQNLRASDIPMTGSMKLLSALDQVLAHVVTIKAEEVAAPAADAGPVAATPAEPEVIKKGKKDEEAGAEGDKPALKGKKK